jgi:hypothetical protein
MGEPIKNLASDDQGPRAGAMTPEQKKLARHALGLPNSSKRSYRNRFTAHPSGTDGVHWKAMTEAGFAEHRPAGDGQTFDFFFLTRAGAERALEAKERLDPEDFPSIGAH